MTPLQLRFGDRLGPEVWISTGRCTQRSIKDPEGFWAEQAEQFIWFKKWDKVRDYQLRR